MFGSVVLLIANFLCVLFALFFVAKYKVLKEVRKLVPTMALIECKALIEKLPAKIKEDVPVADAEKAKEAIEAAGGKVEFV